MDLRESQHRWWEYLRTKAGVRIESRTTPLGPVVHDYVVERSTLPKGGEDEFFQDQTLRGILRRGISFIEVEPGEVPVLLRRGVPKFFDVSPEVIREFYEHCGNARCAVVSTEKANGENAQISRYRDWWVIASKNVCLIAKSADDVEMYKESRYRHASEIGRIFFSMLEGIDAPRRQLCEDYCRTNTLVGELTGYAQHFVRYEKREILFFAIVPKDGSLPCRSPLDAISHLQSFGLPVIRTRMRVGIFSAVVGIGDPVFSENSEGCVSYVFCRGQVVGMYKYKTRRYQLLRKLRAKGKRLATGGVLEATMMTEFRREFNENEEPLLRSELEELATRLFATILNDKLSSAQVDSQFLDVIDTAKTRQIARPLCFLLLCPPFIQAQLCKDNTKLCADESEAKTLLNAGKDVVVVFHSPKLAYNFIASKRSAQRQFHIALIQTGWCQAGIEESLRLAKKKRNVEGLTKQCATFWKQVDKWEILLEKWQEILAMVTNADSLCEIPHGGEVNLAEIREAALTQAGKTSEVCIALGLPGMGKSTLLNKLGIPVVSSDAIFAQLSGSYEARRPLVREEFNKAWRRRLKEDAFALDKNFAPESLFAVLREIHQECLLLGKCVRIRIFLFVESTEFENRLWSWKAASECASRLVHRTEHETLSVLDSENKTHALRVLFSFYALWKEWSVQRLVREVMEEFCGTIVFHHIPAPRGGNEKLKMLLEDWVPWSKQHIDTALLPPQVCSPLPKLDLLVNTASINYMALTFENDRELQGLANRILQPDCTVPETFHCTIFHHTQKIIFFGAGDYSIEFDSALRHAGGKIAILPVAVFLADQLLQRGHITLGWGEPWKAKHGALLEDPKDGEIQTQFGTFSVEEVPDHTLRNQKRRAVLRVFERR